MRKLIVMLLAGAVLAPAAWAQDAPPEHRHGSEAERPRGDHGDRSGGPREGGGQRPAAPPAAAPAPAAAQPRPQAFQRQPGQPRPNFAGQPDGRPGWQGRGDWRGQRGQPPVPAGQPAAFAGNRDGRGFNRPSQADPNAARVQAFGGRPDDRRPGGYDDRRRFDDQRRFDDSRRFDDARGFGGDRRTAGYGGRADWNRDWHRDNRYDWNRYRSANRAAFRLPRYAAPYGWGYGYRRFAIGVTLFSGLWAEDYWIDDPYDYRLPPAYGPYRWVRYYNDALLVDVRNGYVVDTVYDIFY